MKLIRLYPNVYCDIIENKALFFDITSKSIQQFKFSKIVAIPNKTSLIVSAFPEDQQFQNIIHHFGYIDEVDDCHIDVLTDYSTEVSEYYENLLNLQCDSLYVAQKFVTNLLVDLTGEHGMTFNSKKGGSIMSGTTLSHLFRIFYKFKRLRIIHFESNWESIQLLTPIVEQYPQIKDMIHVTFPLEEFLHHKKEILSSYKLIDLSIADIGSISVNDLIKIQSNSHVRHILVDVKSPEDFVLFEELVSSSEKLHIRLSNLSKIKFLQDYLTYDLATELKDRESKYQLIRKEYINPLYWGKLFISSNGDILFNHECSIGNIMSWDNIDFSLLTNSKKSLWRMIRKEFELCNMCINRNLCHPLTLVEANNHLVFCNKNKERYEVYES